MPSPTHIVTLHCERTRAVHQFQCFSLDHARAYLAVYQTLGWFGVIVEVGRND